MQTGVIAVMGATRNIGKKIADALLKADEKVRALGRSKSKLAALKRAGW
jgi:short-subunit dehydrogenase